MLLDDWIKTTVAWGTRELPQRIYRPVRPRWLLFVVTALRVTIIPPLRAFHPVKRYAQELRSCLLLGFWLMFGRVYQGRFAFFCTANRHYRCFVTQFTWRIIRSSAIRLSLVLKCRASSFSSGMMRWIPLWHCRQTRIRRWVISSLLNIFRKYFLPCTARGIRWCSVSGFCRVQSSHSPTGPFIRSV